MGIVFFIPIVSGALLALVAAIFALRAWLSFRRARLALQRQLSEDVARLAVRTGELEQSVAALDARTQQLPVRISRIQDNLATLRILTRALAGSLGQAQKVLSFSQLKVFSAARIAEILPSRSGKRRR